MLACCAVVMIAYCIAPHPAFPDGAFKKDSKKDKDHWSIKLTEETNTDWVVKLMEQIGGCAGTNGLFRKPGSESKVKALMKRVNENPCCSFDVNKDGGAHVLVGLLKRFLLNLSAPLIPYNQLEFWQQVAGAGCLPHLFLLLLLLFLFAVFRCGVCVACGVWRVACGV